MGRMARRKQSNVPKLRTDWTFSSPITIAVGVKPEWDAVDHKGSSAENTYAEFQVSQHALEHSSVLGSMIESSADKRLEFAQFDPPAFHTFLSLLHNQQFAAAFSSTPVLTLDIVLDVLPIAVFLDVAVVLKPVLTWIESNACVAALAAYDSVPSRSSIRFWGAEGPGGERASFGAAGVPRARLRRATRLN